MGCWPAHYYVCLDATAKASDPMHLRHIGLGHAALSSENYSKKGHKLK